MGHQQKGNTLFAFDAITGQLLWESEVEARQVEAWTNSTKVTSEGLHLIDANGKHCLVNPETGGISRIANSTGTVVNGVCYSTEPSGYDSILCADDLAASTRKWENIHYARCPIITVEHGLVFLYDRSPYGPFYDIITLSEATGEYRWSQNKFYTYGTEFILINGIGYAGTPCGIMAFDAMTGETKWEFEPDFIRQDNDKWSEFNAFAKKIALANGMLYAVANKAEELYALDERTGCKIWAYSPYASFAPT